MTESNLTKYQHILVVDLEATCDDLQTIPRHQMETIEIGAVMVDLEHSRSSMNFKPSSNLAAILSS
jgi:3'-5' exoribonuclease 1